MLVRSLVVVLIASAGSARLGADASAELVMVRVVGDNVTVKSRPSRIAETLAKPQHDDVLEVLVKEGSWFWVLVESDSHGTQRAGWVQRVRRRVRQQRGRALLPGAHAAPGSEEPPERSRGSSGSGRRLPRQ